MPKMKLYISNINDLNYSNYIDIKSYKNLQTGNYLFNKLINEDIINFIYNKNNLSIVIPFEIDESYDFELFINHLRTEQEGLFDKVPVIVYLRDADHLCYFYDNYENSKLNNIGVVFSKNPSENDIYRANNEFNDQALEDYIKLISSEPASTSSSHDKSNFWGPYIFLTSLCLIDKGNQKAREYSLKIKDKLSEEIFYKKLIQEHENTEPDTKLLKRVIKEKERLEDFLLTGNVQRVLCIDDQMVDGWEVVYKLLFKDIVSYARNASEAKDIANNSDNIDLVLIDIRLDIVADKDKPIEELSGVRLSETIRKNHKTLPIIAATASNKSWTLEALFERGINSYWVKASPELIRTKNSGLKNVLDLYKKINATLKWSILTREWQDRLYEIADNVKRTTVNKQLAERLESKAKSLQALLFRSFTPFVEDLSKGLQLNLAFLLIYSCLNDLTEWMCTIGKPGKNDECQWFLDGDERGTPLAEKKMDKFKKKFRWYIQDGNDEYPSIDFPDKRAIRKILINKSLSYDIFDELCEIRNGLPLIHGKTDPSGSTAKTIEKVTPEQIDLLVKLLVELKDHHLAVLKTCIK